MAAGVSAAFKKLGFDVIGVDKFVPKSPKVMITKLDLTQSCNQQLVFDWISLPQVRGVFLAPPCGTASLACNIQDPEEPDLPQPLRSWDEPDGLQNLNWISCVLAKPTAFMNLLQLAKTFVQSLENFVLARIFATLSFGELHLGWTESHWQMTLSRFTKHVPTAPLDPSGPNW